MNKFINLKCLLEANFVNLKCLPEAIFGAALDCPYRYFIIQIRASMLSNRISGE